MEKKLIALQTIVILPIIIITSAWICSLQRLSDGVYFFAITVGTFFVYEIFFNHYCEKSKNKIGGLPRQDTTTPISTPTPISPPPACGSTVPDLTGVNLLREIRDLLKDAEDDAYFTNLPTFVISLFAGLVAITALLLIWFQMASAPGLSADVQKSLGVFGNWIISLEVFFVILIVICAGTPVISKYVKKRRKQNQRISPPQ